MATGVASWSTTAASNSTADSAVNWAEGQAPSSVNDSARAMMASVAKYRDDTEGTLTTAGTSTAYTITTGQSFASLSALDGNKLTLRFNATNGASATLAVDGLDAKAIQTSQGTAVAAGAILANSIHSVTYDNSNNCFLLHDRLVVTPHDTTQLFKVLSADDTGANSSTAQPWFPTAGAVTVAASTTYLMEGLLMVTSGTTAHTFRLSFGGTATLTRIGFVAYANGEATAGDTGGLDATRITSASDTTVIASGGNAEHVVFVSGVVTINAGGTLIPNFRFGVAPGGTVTVQDGTFFKLTPLVSTSQGTWA